MTCFATIRDGGSPFARAVTTNSRPIVSASPPPETAPAPPPCRHPASGRAAPSRARSAAGRRRTQRNRRLGSHPSLIDTTICSNSPSQNTGIAIAVALATRSRVPAARRPQPDDRSRPPPREQRRSPPRPASIRTPPEAAAPISRATGYPFTSDLPRSPRNNPPSHNTVLQHHGTIEPKLMAERHELIRRRAVAEHERSRVARQHVEQRRTAQSRRR